MKKLLFVTPELPYPAQSGGKLKSLKLLNTLSQQYDVTLACPLKMDDSLYVDEFHAVSPCREHLHEDLSVSRSPRSLLLSYLRRIPLNVHRTKSAKLNSAIEDIADQFDVIFLDHYEVYAYMPNDFEGLTIYHAHNAYFKMWERYSKLPGNPALRVAAFFEARRVRSYEAKVGLGTNMTFAAPNDALELSASGVPVARLYNTFHLGDDTQLELPDLQFENTRKKLMYVGFLGWEPNVQGLLWFIKRVWPLLLQLHPDIEMDIVGKNPDDRLKRAVAQCKGIKLRGFVADLQSIYHDSRVSVAPLLFGSGMKVKVLDAMARGMPTVTTSVGAEGIDVESGKHLLVSDEPEHMAAQIHSLLIDPPLWQELQTHSRALVRERYTWEQLFRQMHRSIEERLARHHQQSAPRDLRLIPHAG